MTLLLPANSVTVGVRTGWLISVCYNQWNAGSTRQYKLMENSRANLQPALSCCISYGVTINARQIVNWMESRNFFSRDHSKNTPLLWERNSLPLPLVFHAQNILQKRSLRVSFPVSWTFGCRLRQERQPKNSAQDTNTNHMTHGVRGLNGDLKQC